MLHVVLTLGFPMDIADIRCTVGPARSLAPPLLDDPCLSELRSGRGGRTLWPGSTWNDCGRVCEGGTERRLVSVTSLALQSRS